MSFTDRQWRREYKRLPKWKELKLARDEYKSTMVAKVDKKYQDLVNQSKKTPNT